MVESGCCVVMLYDRIGKVPRRKAVVWSAICHVSVERKGNQSAPVC